MADNLKPHPRELAKKKAINKYKRKKQRKDFVAGESAARVEAARRHGMRWDIPSSDTPNAPGLARGEFGARYEAPRYFPPQPTAGQQLSKLPSSRDIGDVLKKPIGVKPPGPRYGHESGMEDAVYHLEKDRARKSILARDPYAVIEGNPLAGQQPPGDRGGPQKKWPPKGYRTPTKKEYGAGPQKKKKWPPKGYRTPTREEYGSSPRGQSAFEYQKRRGLLGPDNTRPLSQHGWAENHPNEEYPRPLRDRDPNWKPGDFLKKDAEREAKRLEAIRAKYKGEAERRYRHNYNDDPEHNRIYGSTPWPRIPPDYKFPISNKGRK